MGRPYCAKCGWNRDAAARRLQRVTWLLPALIVFFDLIGIIGIGFVMKNWPGAILFATLPTLLLAFVYAGARQGLTKLRAPAASAPASDSTVVASTAAIAQVSSANEKAEQYNFLLSLPPPRPVRLGRRGEISLTVILLVAFTVEALLIWNLYGTWYRTHSFADFHAPEIVLVCLAILIAGIPFFVRRGMVRDQELVENGAVAIARVTGQRTLKNNSTITYEFEDAAANTISRSANDLTRSFYEGMTVPVFYDPQNSARHVAACAAFFEVSDLGKD
ncbi:MAG: hypothetical protein ACYC92_04265 [Candidatus Acidiferrales bacterium]